MKLFSTMTRGSRLPLATLTVCAALSLAALPAMAQSSGGGNGGGGGGGGGSSSGGSPHDANRFNGFPIGSLFQSRPRAERRVVYEEIEYDDAPAVRKRRPAPSARAKPSKPASVARKPSPKPGPALAASDDRSIVPNEVLVELKPGAPAGTVATLAQRQRLDTVSTERFELTGTTLTRYRIRDGRSVARVVRALGADPAVRSAQPNHVYTLSQQPASGLAATQYAVAKMRLNEAHRSATGASVSVAIIDSGVDAGHPALDGAIAESFDGVGGPYKPHAHGTAVAGLVGARGDLASVAPAARIFAARAFTGEETGARDGSEGTTLHILRGLDWASKRGAQVINMSFAGPRDAKIAEFIAAGVAKGAIHVAAAGNAGPASPPLYPAADPNVIAVTATDVDDKLLPVANRGKHLCVAAPGVDVLVAAPGGAYGYLSGTSMASAEISGAVALMLQIRPALTLAEARAALAKTARDLGRRGFDTEFGAGEADAKAAVDAVALRPSAVSAPVRETAAARP